MSRNRKSRDGATPSDATFYAEAPDFAEGSLSASRPSMATSSSQPATQPDALTYPRSIVAPIDQGHMAASMPATSNVYPNRPDIQPAAYYPVHAGGPSPQPQAVYLSPGYGQYQEQWAQRLPVTRYGQVAYGYPLHSQYYPPYTNLGPQAPQNQYPNLQYIPYVDQRQGLPPDSLGSPPKTENLISKANLPVQTVPRGPPRKPKQSGHALWVGNLSQSTTIIDLKEHFSRGAKADIESVKLISKSNCAFVNYRTHEACASAMERFHDSKFHGTRLVCRLRRTLPLSASSPSALEPLSPVVVGSSEGFDDGDYRRSSIDADVDTTSRKGLKDRYFILKSLTFHDLEISTWTGSWATQSHNEEMLNAAYESSENVYLFFSANKSGGYFGYARMASSIATSSGQSNVAEANGVEAAPITLLGPELSNLTLSGPSEALPRAIVTPETPLAPKGSIIDDMARGTIFWEVDVAEDVSQHDALEVSASTSDQPPYTETKAGYNSGGDDTNDAEVRRSSVVELESLDRSQMETGSPSTQAPRSPAIASSMYGLESIDPSPRQADLPTTAPAPAPAPAPPLQNHGNANSFRVDWIVIHKLPFYKCRGLKNPWNANKEVKIARDGTELETSVGRRLIALFKSQ